MLSNVFKAAIIIATLFSSPVESASVSMQDIPKYLEDFNWFTEEYPPYNYVGENGQPQGIFVDLLMSALKLGKVNVKQTDLVIAPWSDSYLKLLQTPKTGLFAMTYTPERAKHFKYVMTPIPSRVSIIAAKSMPIKVNSTDDLATLRIGVIQDDIGHQLIQKIALSDALIIKTKSLSQLISLLTKGRIDAIAYSPIVFRKAINRRGENPDDYTEIIDLKNNLMGYAFHKSTPDEVLKYIEVQISILVANGTLQKILTLHSQ